MVVQARTAYAQLSQVSQVFDFEVSSPVSLTLVCLALPPLMLRGVPCIFLPLFRVVVPVAVGPVLEAVPLVELGVIDGVGRIAPVSDGAVWVGHWVVELWPCQQFFNFSVPSKVSGVLGTASAVAVPVLLLDVVLAVDELVLVLALKGTAVGTGERRVREVLLLYEGAVVVGGELKGAVGERCLLPVLVAVGDVLVDVTAALVNLAQLLLQVLVDQLVAVQQLVEARNRLLLVITVSIHSNQERHQK